MHNCVSARSARKFNEVEVILDQILKNINYRSGKSKTGMDVVNSYTTVKHPIFSKSITYDFGSPGDEDYSSISVDCNSTECLIEADLVVAAEDTSTQDVIKSVFDELSCGIIDIHIHPDKHGDVKHHHHVMCLRHPKEVHQKLISIHNVLVK